MPLGAASFSTSGNAPHSARDSSRCVTRSRPIRSVSRSMRLVVSSTSNVSATLSRADRNDTSLAAKCTVFCITAGDKSSSTLKPNAWD